MGEGAYRLPETLGIDMALSLRRGLRRATVPQFNMVASLRAQSALAMFPVSLGLLRPVSATGGGLRAPLFPSGKRRLRVLTKSRKNEALIRNDGVYVISGIFCRANACVCGKNAFPPRPLAVGGREAAGGASTRSAQRRNTGPP